MKNVKPHNIENKEHKLKIKSEHFSAVINKTKTAEIRYNDRNYQVGDILNLNEINSLGNFTGNSCQVVVTHILDNSEYFKTGYVMLSFNMLHIDRLETKNPKIIENGVGVLNVFMTYKNAPCAGIALVTDDDQTIIITPCLELLLEIRNAIDNAINVLDPDYLKKEINKIKA